MLLIWNQKRSLRISKHLEQTLFSQYSQQRSCQHTFIDWKSVEKDEKNVINIDVKIKKKKSKTQKAWSVVRLRLFPYCGLTFGRIRWKSSFFTNFYSFLIFYFSTPTRQSLTVLENLSTAAGNSGTLSVMMSSFSILKEQLHRPSVSWSFLPWTLTGDKHSPSQLLFVSLIIFYSLCVESVSFLHTCLSARITHSFCLPFSFL